MTARNFFTFQSVINFLFGLGLLFIPQMMVDSFAVQKQDVTGLLDFVGRGYGSLLFGLSVMGFLMRNADASTARTAYLIGTLVAGLAVIVIHIKAILQGVENSSGWITVLLVAVIAVWSGMLLSREKSQSL